MENYPKMIQRCKKSTLSSLRKLERTKSSVNKDVIQLELHVNAVTMAMSKTQWVDKSKYQCRCYCNVKWGTVSWHVKILARKKWTVTESFSITEPFQQNFENLIYCSCFCNLFVYLSNFLSGWKRIDPNDKHLPAPRLTLEDKTFSHLTRSDNFRKPSGINAWNVDT